MTSSPFLMIPGGLYDQLLVAVCSAPEKRLDQVSSEIAKAHSNAMLDDEVAGRLYEDIDRRRKFFGARRQVGNARRRSATWRVDVVGDLTKKQRTWAFCGALPHALRWMFTKGEHSVAAVVRAEVQKKGSCTLPYHLIAKAAGLRSTTVVKRFMRQAKKHHLIKVQERIGDRGLNRPNVVTIISDEWLSWIAYEQSVSKGGTNVPTNQKQGKILTLSPRGEIAKVALEKEKAAAVEPNKPAEREVANRVNIRAGKRWREGGATAGRGVVSDFLPCWGTDAGRNAR